MTTIGFKHPDTQSHTDSIVSENKINLHQHSIALNDTGVHIHCGNKLTVTSEISSIQASHTNWTSTNSISLHTAGALTIEAKAFKINGGNSNITLTNEHCYFSSDKLTLQTTNAPSETLCCEGDYQTCPASSGSKPHIGSTLSKGSKTTFIQGHGIIRHGDRTQCHGEPNQVISHCHSILVDGLPIAHTSSTLQHGGTLTASQQTVQLMPSHDTTTDSAFKKQDHQLLEVHIRMFGENDYRDEQYNLTIHMQDNTRSPSSHYQPIILSGLQLQDLDGQCQIDIEDKAYT